MHRVAAALLGVISLVLVALGVWLMIYWISRPLGPQFAAGEMVGTAVGFAIVVAGVGIAFTARGVWQDRRGAWIGTGVVATAAIIFSYVALSTPGPPPVPLQISVAGLVIGIALGLVMLARLAGRRAS